jgi:soluble lytic murein transglycosylase
MFTRLSSHFILLAALLTAAPAAHAFLVDEESQRRDYQAALAALRAGETARYKKLRESLDGYVLRGYLDYESLKDRIDQVPNAEVRAFLDANAHIPGADAVRKRWLRRLAARGDWDTFLAEYKNVEDDPELQCLRLDRLLRSSEQQTALMQEIETLWTYGRRLPVACNAVFAAWRKAGHMTPEKIWLRIRLAMELRQLGLAEELSQFLDARDRVWVSRWGAMHRDPANELSRISFPVETPVARMVVRHGVVRLAMRDVDEALQRWEALKQKYQFFGEDDNYVMRYLGIIAAQDHAASAVQLLSRVSADPNDESLHLWRMRAALRANDWAAAKSFIAALPEERRQKQEGRYWMARAMEQSGQPDEARAMYKVLARERGYYGFLAADRIKEDYAMQHQPIVATGEEVSAMLARPGVLAAQELLAMGLTTDARRQWQWITRHMNNRELAVAALLAREWGWHDRAILTVSKSDHQNDLELRFPLLYRDAIEANATRQGIDPGWVYGVVRQESAFVPDARSHAGALGLMQLMPATGLLTGQRLNLPLRGTRAILEVENNITLGVGYLKDVLTRNANHQTLATAAYNAGPNRVKEWTPAAGLDADIWVETIPFNETRDYVKNVMAFTAVYDHRLGRKPVRLQDRMPMVGVPAKSQ